MKNVETLIYRTIRFLHIAQDDTNSAGSPIQNRNSKILNAVRILTRVLPYIYQAEHLRDWEENFFWTQNHDQNIYADGADGRDSEQEKPKPEFDGLPLGAVLIECLLDYLFFPTLTQPPRADGTLKPTRTVWQSGIGSNRGSGMNKEHEKAALEVLRLLLVLASRSMYIPPGQWPATL